MTSQHRPPYLSFIMRGAAVALITSSLAVFVACAPKKSTFDPLLNQGVMPVSDNNPFMGANLFLAHEMEQSVYLYNFMKDKGAPQAIELKGTNSEDVEAHFFYTANQEEFVAKPAPQTGSRRLKDQDIRREWIIIGPFAIDRQHYRDVQQLENTSGGAFEIFGKREFLGKARPHGTEIALRPVFIPTPVPKRAPVRKKVVAPTGDSSVSTLPETKEPVNFDQLALREARTMVERDREGDVIHTVKSKTETLQAIAQWYTGKTDSAKDIATKNAIPVDAKLTPGAKVVVPKSLVSNFAKMK